MSPSFNYSAKDREGRTVTGTMEASSEIEVARALRETNLLPNRISASKRASAGSGGDIIQRVFLGPPLAQQMFFFKQLAAMLSAGVTLAEGLGKMAARGRGGRLRPAIREAAQHVSAGGRLSEAFGRYPWLFGRLQLALIEAGETSGLLDQSINEMFGYLEKELALRRKLSMATLYPKLALLMALVILKLPVPVLQEALGPLTQLPEYIVGGGIGLWILFRLSRQIPTFAYGLDAAKLAIPGIGSLVRKLSLMRFARALAALYSAGFPVAAGVELAARASSNEVVSQSLLRAVPMLRSGIDPTTALSRTGALTDLMEDMLSTGQMTGNLDSMMEKVAEYYEGETDATLTKVTIGVSVLAFLAVAALVLLIVVQFYSGMLRREGL